MKRFFLLPVLCLLAVSPLNADSATSSPETSILTPKEAKALPPPEAKDEKTAPKEDLPPFEPNQEPMHMPTYGGTMTKMILTLLGLVAMVLITVWLLKKLTQGRLGAFGKRTINVVERRPLSPKTILYVVEFSGKQILVAESQLEVKTLSQIDTLASS